MDGVVKVIGDGAADERRGTSISMKLRGMTGYPDGPVEWFYRAGRGQAASGEQSEKLTVDQRD
jgi:hypothetical protein